MKLIVSEGDDLIPFFKPGDYLNQAVSAGNSDRDRVSAECPAPFSTSTNLSDPA